MQVEKLYVNSCKVVKFIDNKLYAFKHKNSFIDVISPDEFTVKLRYNISTFASSIFVSEIINDCIYGISHDGVIYKYDVLNEKMSEIGCIYFHSGISEGKSSLTELIVSDYGKYIIVKKPEEKKLYYKNKLLNLSCENLTAIISEDGFLYGLKKTEARSYNIIKFDILANKTILCREYYKEISKNDPLKLFLRDKYLLILCDYNKPYNKLLDAYDMVNLGFSYNLVNICHIGNNFIITKQYCKYLSHFYNQINFDGKTINTIDDALSSDTFIGITYIHNYFFLLGIYNRAIRVFISKLGTGCLGYIDYKIINDDYKIIGINDEMTGLFIKSTNNIIKLDITALHLYKQKLEFLKGSITPESSINKFIKNSIHDYHTIKIIFEYLPALK
jgi:hypothetical protein